MNNNWNRNQMRGSYKGGGGRGHGRGRGSGGFWPSRGFRGSNNRFDRGGRSGQYFDRNVNNQWTPRPKPEAPSKRLSERDIFVTEYISDHEGFNGIIKSRFSDFQVSEINLKGEVAKLTDLSPPEPVKEDYEVEDDEDLLLKKYNLEILPMETWDKINKLAIANNASSVKRVEIDATGMTKQERTKIHDAVKKAFGECIIGSTITVDDKKFVTFDKYRKGVRVDKRVKWLWPGEYVHFIMYKQNLDTMEAASRIAERLRLTIRPSMLGYSGTKDRRAKTSQWLSLRKVDPRKIAQCNDLRDIRVGNYSFADYPLKLGMLKGNEFRICLRNVTASDECINNACSLLEKNGFVNYYGLQRFGTRVELPTYEIGRKLLQGKFREAINVILGTSEWRQLRPRPHSPEARLLSVLLARPNDLLSALDKLPRNSRLLYVHAYQSLVWNRAASRRLTALPRRPAPGDLVALHDDIDEHSDEEEEENDEVDKEEIDKPETDKQEIEKKKKEKKVEEKKQIAVKVVTQEDIDNNSFTIFDIVLPLPGHSVIYPPNMKDFYESVLAEDGLTLDMKHKYKKYWLSGGYRRVVAAARGVRWRPARYRRPRADLLLSDLDRLLGRADADTGIDEDGKYKALLLTMSLPTSCYATMALRELLRVDTSCDNQALQNNYHKNDNQTSPSSERNNSNRSNKSDSNYQCDSNIDQRDGNIDQRDVKIDERDGNINKSDGNIDESDGNIDERDGNIDERDGNIDESYGNIDERDDNIGDCDSKSEQHDISCDQNESFEESAGDKRKMNDSDDAVDSKKAKLDD